MFGIFKESAEEAQWLQTCSKHRRRKAATRERTDARRGRALRRERDVRLARKLDFDAFSHITLQHCSAEYLY